MYGSRDMSLSLPRAVIPAFPDGKRLLDQISEHLKIVAGRQSGERAANQGETWAGGGPCAGLGRKRYARAVQPPFLSPFRSPFRGCACGIHCTGGGQGAVG